MVKDGGKLREQKKEMSGEALVMDMTFFKQDPKEEAEGRSFKGILDQSVSD